MKDRLYNPVKRPPNDAPEMDTHSETETAGYIPERIQIENMLMSGKILSEFREEMYDFGGQVPTDDSFNDPTRSPNYDMADATRDAREVENKHKAAEKAAEKARKAEEQERLDLANKHTEEKKDTE